MLPSRAALTALVSLVAVLAMFTVMLYALTPQGERRTMLTMLAPATAGVLAGVPAFLAWLVGQRLTINQRETAEAIARVEAQTNGPLQAKITEENDRLREELLEQILPSQRAAVLAALAERALVGKRITDPPSPPTVYLPPTQREG